MPARMKPWTEAILHHVADGRWYQREEVIRVGMRAVPPGRALQERERNRVRLAVGTGARPARTADERIAAGARHLSRGSLLNLISRGHLEADGDLIRAVS
jgi:Arc/MetJ-type ribon-helix-helix transcriptional regulator